MDEAHLTIAKTYKNIINNLAPNDNTGVLGLSVHLDDLIEMLTKI